MRHVPSERLEIGRGARANSPHYHSAPGTKNKIALRNSAVELSPDRFLGDK